MIIRKFCESDAEKVSALIIHTLQASNSKDYSAETISALEKKMQPSGVLERASWTHFYVAEEGGDIIGCGAIGLCPPRKNRQKMQAKNRMKRMTNIIQNCSIGPHLFHGSLDNEPLKV